MAETTIGRFLLELLCTTLKAPKKPQKLGVYKSHDEISLLPKRKINHRRMNARVKVTVISEPIVDIKIAATSIPLRVDTAPSA